MNSVNKTLYIPLYGKSHVSQKGLFLHDEKAQQIWAAEGFPLKGKSRSKWLAYYMGIRAAVFDDWVSQQLRVWPDATVIHLGCGMDSRVLRVSAPRKKWYDVDLPPVIRERCRYFTACPGYEMLPGDAGQGDWLDRIPETGRAVIVMEGLSMYLTPGQLQNLASNLQSHFSQIRLLMDCYTPLAAKLSRYKNPINDVGVTKVYGVEDPRILNSAGILFTQELPMTPTQYIAQLHGTEKRIFEKLYAGSFSKKLYRLFAYEKN